MSESGDNIYKTVRISAVSVVTHSGEWWLVGYPKDWNLNREHPYIIAICDSFEEARDKLARYQERINAHNTFPRGVRQHLYEYLIP